MDTGRAPLRRHGICRKSGPRSTGGGNLADEIADVSFDLVAAKAVTQLWEYAHFSASSGRYGPRRPRPRGRSVLFR